MKKLLENYGRDGMVLYALGEEYEALGDLEQALSFYEEAYKRFPLQKWKAKAYEAAERVRGLRHQVSWENLTIDDDTLFVVNCTARKIWSICRNAPAKLPAILVYQGTSFRRFLARIAELEKRFGRIHWVVLSAKYGFLEPCAVIENYDTKFGDPDAISDAELRQQVLMKSVEGRSLSSFKKVYIYTNSNTYFEKVAEAFQGIARCYRIKD